nr:hypothetical protein [Shewanella dokdonensis]
MLALYTLPYLLFLAVGQFGDGGSHAHAVISGIVLQRIFRYQPIGGGQDTRFKPKPRALAKDYRLEVQ